MEEDQKEATWEELLGSRNWEGLLEPLSVELTRLILRCGDLIQVTYDTFINDKASKYCGCSRYGKSTLLEKVLFPAAADYDVVSFLYATARVSVPEAFLMKSQSRERWDRESNWIGFVAVSNDRLAAQLGRRDIYVVWRGTTRNYEWIDVLGADLQSAKELLRSDHQTNGRGDDDDDDDGVPKVMKGWMTIYVSDDPKSPFTKTSARTQLLAKLNHLIQRYKEEKLSIILTGHSLGASLSIVSAFDIAENLTQSIPVSAVVFGCPKVGNKNFNERFKSYSSTLNALHIKNEIDLIPHYPARVMGYVNTGTDLVIDTRKSPYLKDSKNPSDWHNLQAMLHVVNGWHGKDGEFKDKVKRSLALVNKSCEFLKEECMVPASWWIVKNKGMVLNDDGDWIMGEPEGEDLPVTESPDS
ncbi:hypothetical protein V2J09_009392 [Rumex salicifolius]